MNSIEKIISTGPTEWRNENGQHHREDGPAFISRTGSWQWVQNGLTHRTDGPAVYWKNWLNGEGDDKYIKHTYGWYINDVDITLEVIKWVEDNNLPKWPDWDDEIKTLFKLRFA